MLAKISLSLCLLLLLLFSNCANDSDKSAENDTKDTYFIEKIDSIIVPVDSTGVFESEDYSFFEENGKQYLSILDDAGRNYFIYSWPGLQLIKKFSIPQDGPDGIPSISPTYFSSSQFTLDSIWFFDFNTSAFYLYNAQGNKVKRIAWDLDRLQSTSTPFTSTPFINCTLPIRRDRDGNYIVSIANSFRVRNANLSETPSIAKFRIQGDTVAIQQLFAFYPEVYNNGWYGLEPFLYTASFIWNEALGAYLVSFPADPEIYVYDEKGKLIRKSEVQSRYFNEVKPMRNKSFLQNIASRKIDAPDVDDRGKYLHETSYYGHLIRFESLKLNARLCYINGPNKNHTDFSLILFDDAFNILGEHFFDGKTHIASWCFMAGDQYFVLNDEKTFSASNEDRFFFDGFGAAKKQLPNEK